MRLRPAAVLTAAIVLIAVGAMGGWLAASIASRDDQVRWKAASNEPEQFQRWALLIYGSPSRGPQDGRELASIYGGWIRDLRGQGRMAFGERLQPVAWSPSDQLAPSGAALKGARVSGLVLFEAADEDEARRLAESFPHVEFGGRVDLHRVDTPD